MITTAVAAVVGFSATVQATPTNPFTGDNVESGQAILASSSSSDSITVFYGVNLVSGTYTYNYQIFDTSTHGGASGTGDIVEAFNVGFNTAAPGAVTGGNFTSQSLSGLFWTFAPVLDNGVSGVLDFTSLLSPALGNANAQDSNPPSPWASVPGGQQVPVPTVPDGGTTVMLLGAALSGLGLLRKKLAA